MLDNKLPADAGNDPEETTEYWTNHAFTGTESYYRVWTNLVATDGVKEMADELNCYWALNDIAVMLVPQIEAIEDTFAVVKVHVDLKTNEADILLDDGNYNVYYTYHVPFTDLKCNLRLFLQKGENWVVMLPSEY
jgi:hypothetical protein